MKYQDIFKQNKKWIEEKLRSNRAYFTELSEGQKPDFLFIGCSDSRVTAEELMGAQPGEVFVHRNIANLVPNNDNSSSAVVEYAVNHLDVKHIIVCGHYNCGGIKAAMQPRDLGLLNPWLRSIRDVYRLHKDELNAISDDEDRYKRLVELNVQEQCANIIKMASWQKKYLKHGYPQVHALIFDIHTGHLVDLNIDFDQVLAGIREIYDLGSED
ncbi:MAG TPA: carbonic anhydrase [Flavihumibacter sp.]|jgi:carbonic anhydrase